MFRSTASGSSELWIVERSGGVPRRLTTGRHVTFHEFAAAGDWLIFGSDPNGVGRDAYFLIRPTGDQECELVPRDNAFRTFGGFSPDGTCIAFTSLTDACCELRLMDIYTRRAEVLYRGDLGVSIRGWSPDGRRLLLSAARGSRANAAYLFDRRTGELIHVGRATEPSKCGSFAWHPDGQQLLFVSNHDTEFARICSFDVRDCSVAPMLSRPFDIEQVTISPSGRIVAWTVNRNGYTSIECAEYREGQLREDSTLPGPVVPEGWHRIGWAAHVDLAVIAIAGPTMFGDFWLWEPREQRTSRVTRFSDNDAGRARSTPQHRSIESVDGLLIHGWLYPADEGIETRAAIVSLHGGPSHQARPRFNPLFQSLNRHGVAVFDLNYRGSTGYGRQYESRARQQRRHEELLDLQAAARWLPTAIGGGLAKIGVMGESYGGYLSLAALASLPAHFDFGIAISGVSDWISALTSASPSLKLTDASEFGDLAQPDQREYLRLLSPLNKVGDIVAPLLVIHGRDDPHVPVEQSDEVVSALRALDRHVEYLRLENEGHSFSKSARRMIANRIVRFVQVQVA